MTGNVVKFPSPEERASKAEDITAVVDALDPRLLPAAMMYVERMASDPVYAVIETHRAASIAYDRAVNHPAVGDSSHPQCAEKERVSDRAQRELFKQIDRLFAFMPSTSAGVASLLQYISSLRDWELPGCFSEPREIIGMQDLCRSMAAALDGAGPAVPAPGDNTRDPIFATIDEHRRAYAEFVSDCSDPDDKFETDDAALNVADRAAAALLTVEPTTIAGAAALLSYYAEQTFLDETFFPETVQSGKDEGEPFAAVLARSASAALTRINMGAANHA